MSFKIQQNIIPKCLSKILNKFPGNFKENPVVDLQTFFDYFKELNSDVHADDVVGPSNIANINMRSYHAELCIALYFFLCVIII
jgi:hypothetical protein